MVEKPGSYQGFQMVSICLNDGYLCQAAQSFATPKLAQRKYFLIGSEMVNIGPITYLGPAWFQVAWKHRPNTVQSERNVIPRFATPQSCRWIRPCLPTHLPDPLLTLVGEAAVASVLEFQC